MSLHETINEECDKCVPRPVTWVLLLLGELSVVECINKTSRNLVTDEFVVPKGYKVSLSWWIRIAGASGSSL